MGARGRVPRGRAAGRQPAGAGLPRPAPAASGYREQALRLFPHVCARCGREFSGARLRELTVHHKDHDHDNNPPDGSNWELLCLYCHDNEHQDAYARGHYTRDPLARPPESGLGHSPFEALKEQAGKNDDQHEVEK
jgi:hypothetical protein